MTTLQTVATGLSRPEPVTVEYNVNGGRARKTFEDSYEARRFYCAKDKAGKSPRVVREDTPTPGPSPSTTPEGEKESTPQQNSTPEVSEPRVHTKLIAVYVRVSTVSQNEAGQKAAIEDWLRGNGIPASSVEWFVDKASGDTLDRTDFNRLQAAVFAGQISTVVCYKLDRLSRSIREGMNILSDWCARGLRIVSVTQLLDFNGAVGKMLAAVLLGVAEMEQELRKERQAAGIAEARKKGIYKGRKPGTLKAKPERAVELRKQGLATAEIAASLRVSVNTIFRYLRTARPRGNKRRGSK
jgi:DNA invertase Pin-like site-specific DNA recombinase